MIATVGHAPPAALLEHADDVRRGARLADPDDERPGEPELRAVHRQDRRRREAHRHPELDPEQVLGVDGGVVRRAAGGDQHVVELVRTEPSAIRPEPGARSTSRAMASGCSWISSRSVMAGPVQRSRQRDGEPAAERALAEQRSREGGERGPKDAVGHDMRAGRG